MCRLLKLFTCWSTIRPPRIRWTTDRFLFLQFKIWTISFDAVTINWLRCLFGIKSLHKRWIIIILLAFSGNKHTIINVTLICIQSRWSKLGSCISMHIISCISRSFAHLIKLIYILSEHIWNWFWCIWCAHTFRVVMILMIWQDKRTISIRDLIF